MGPKYEFTCETKKRGNSTLHRIRRLADGKIGGWIESEDNLSQEGNCWVDDNAEVFEDARVYGNAQVYGSTEVRGNVKVYDNAKVYGHAFVYGNACVYDNAQVFDNVWLCENAQVYENAQVFDQTIMCGNAQAYGNAKISKDYISTGKYDDTSNINVENEEFEVIKDFVYKIDESSKLNILTNYDSIDAFFEDDSDDSYIECEWLTIFTINTKIPIIKFEKASIKHINIFKFIVDLTNKDGDGYYVCSIIDSKEQFNQLLRSTINVLKKYSQFNKYTDDLENCL